MSPALRQCVHEYGFAIVHAFMESGIKNPKHIHNLVREIWAGARQPNQRQRKDWDKKKRPSLVLEHIDWILIQAGAEVSAATLVRVLWSHGMAIIPRSPSEPMVDASLNALEEVGYVTKRQKHTLRLRAAITAGIRRLWPHLFEQEEAKP